MSDLSLYLIVASIALLVGAGLGYYTAQIDNERNSRERTE